MTKKGSTAKIAAIIVAVMLCVALLTTVLVACSGNTITFETNGGTAVDSVKKTVEKSPLTTKAGFKFDGWYTEKEFTNKVKFPYTAKGDVTLFAKWIEETDADRIKEFYNLLGSALENSIGFVGSQQFGIDVNLGAMGVGLNIKANVDPKDLSKVAANIEVLSGDATVMNIFADDEFLYLVNDTMKKRLKDFDLEAMLGGVESFSTTSYGSLVGSMLGLVLVPENSTYKKDGNSYTVEGSLAGVVELLGDMVPAEIGELLAGMNLRIMATIEDNSIKALAITLVTQLGEVAITSDQLKLGNGVEPAITLPSKTDKTFDETYGLNFSIEGTASFINKNADYTTSAVAEFGYKVYVDYNIFGALRNSFGGDGVGAVGFFGEATQDSKILIDLYHKCNNSCKAFCDTKLGKSEGSFLSLAYSPSDFHGSNDFKIALNPKFIIPDGMLEIVAGMPNVSGLISSMLTDFVGANIDPVALIASLANINTNSAPATVAETAGFDLGSLLNPNVLQIVANAFDLAKSITLNPEGLQVGVTALIDLLANAIPGDINIGQIAQMLFGENTDILNVSAVAEFGDTRIADMDMFLKFMTVSEELAEQKSFKSGGNDYTPTLVNEFVKEADGNVKITKSASSTSTGISTHNEDGTPAVLSPEEAKLLFETGSVATYKYTTIDGSATGTAQAEVLKVIGLDYKVLDTPQHVTVITTPADGDSLSQILGLLQIVGMGKISIPGAMFETTITLTKADVEFSTTLDAGKEYAYGETIDATVKAKATYNKGTDKEVVKEVTFKDANPLTNKGKFNAFLDQSYSYTAYGKEFKTTIKAKADLKQNEVIKKELKIGEKFADLKFDPASGESAPKFNFTYGTDTKLTVALAESSRFIVDSSILVTKETDSWGMGMFGGYSLTFTKSGVFTVTLDLIPGSGITQTYEFTVPEVPSAKYTATSKYVADDMIEVIFGRNNMIQQSLRANVAVTVGDTTLKDTDYKLQVKTATGEFVDLGSLTINANQIIPQIVYVKITNEDYISSMYTATASIKFVAKDFNDYEITTTNTAIFVENNYSLTTSGYQLSMASKLPGKFIKIDRFGFKEEMKDAEYALKFETKKTGESNWTTQTIGTGDGAAIRLMLIGDAMLPDYSMQTIMKDTAFAPINGFQSFTVGDKTAQGSMYIYINDLDLATSEFEYKLSVLATNYDNYIVATASGTQVSYNSYMPTSDARFNALTPSTGLSAGKYIKIDRFNPDMLGLEINELTVTLETRYFSNSVYTEWTDTSFSLVSLGYDKSGETVTPVFQADVNLKLSGIDGFDLTVGNKTVTANQYLLITDTDLLANNFEYRITITDSVSGKTLPIVANWCYAVAVQ